LANFERERNWRRVLEGVEGDEERKKHKRQGDGDTEISRLLI
jgi:hypothetical protein